VLDTTALGTGIPTGGATASPSRSVTPSTGATRGAGSSGGGSVSAGPVTSAPVSWTFTSGRTTPIDPGTVAKILASCLGSDASKYHAVIAVRTPVASRDWDGAVVAVNSAAQYVQCETKGDRGTSQDSPPTFINNRLWNAGHTVEFFDAIGEPAGQGQYLSLGAGHYTSHVAKITVSYGSNPTEYPATMAGGAFFYASDMTTGTSGSSAPATSGAGSSSPSSSGHGSFVAGPTPYLHAYDAAGKEIYNQVKDS
ncbi:hypothetical protein ACEZDB_36575, partial [Streptacidiphilus sp. N1-3]